METLAGGKLRVDEPAPHVVRVTIDSPAKRNALDHEILDALAGLVPRLAARCLVITGTGRVFSAGYDIAALPQDDFPRAAEAIVAHPFASAIEAVDAFPFPVLAALNGHAIGGGLELALSCDLRVCSAEARLGMPPARLGLVYSHTGLRKFVDAVGAPRTRELFFTARAVSADEALGWGLVGEVVPAADVAARAVELAAEIAANAPLSLAGNKRVIRELLAAEGALDPAVEAELVALRDACFASEDFLEGVRAFAREAPAALARALTSVRVTLEGCAASCPSCSRPRSSRLARRKRPRSTRSPRSLPRSIRRSPGSDRSRSASRSPGGCPAASSCPPRDATSGPTTGA